MTAPASAGAKRRQSNWIDDEVACEQSPLRALQQLAGWRPAEQSVAILLAAQWMPQMTGVDFLAQAHEWVRDRAWSA
jgi:hypothetical protein